MQRHEFGKSSVTSPTPQFSPSQRGSCPVAEECEYKMDAPARAVMFKTGVGEFSSNVQLPLCEGENWGLGDVTLDFPNSWRCK